MPSGNVVSVSVPSVDVDEPELVDEPEEPVEPADAVLPREDVPCPRLLVPVVLPVPLDGASMESGSNPPAAKLAAAVRMVLTPRAAPWTGASWTITTGR